MFLPPRPIFCPEGLIPGTVHCFKTRREERWRPRSPGPEQPLSPPFSSALQCHSQLTALQPVDPQQAIRGDPAPRPACQKAAPSEGPQTFRHTLEAHAGPRTGRPAVGSTQNIAFFFFLSASARAGLRQAEPVPLRPCAPRERQGPCLCLGLHACCQGPFPPVSQLLPPQSPCRLSLIHPGT